MGTNPGDSFSTAYTGKGVIYWALRKLFFTNFQAYVHAIHPNGCMCMLVNQDADLDCIDHHDADDHYIHADLDLEVDCELVQLILQPLPQLLLHLLQVYTDFFWQMWRRWWKKDTIKLLLYLLTKTSMITRWIWHNMTLDNRDKSGQWWPEEASPGPDPRLSCLQASWEDQSHAPGAMEVWASS